MIMSTASYLETRDGRRIRLNTPEEEAEILASCDADCLPLTDEDLARMAHTGRSGHPLKRRKEKETVTLALDPDLLSKFRATGEVWELRVNAALREWTQTHEIAA
jgi:uncharacterized protein (DUF4415 family)